MRDEPDKCCRPRLAFAAGVGSFRATVALPAARVSRRSGPVVIVRRSIAWRSCCVLDQGRAPHPGKPQGAGRGAPATSGRLTALGERLRSRCNLRAVSSRPRAHAVAFAVQLAERRPRASPTLAMSLLDRRMQTFRNGPRLSAIRGTSKVFAVPHRFSIRRPRTSFANHSCTATTALRQEAALDAPFAAIKDASPS